MRIAAAIMLAVALPATAHAQWAPQLQATPLSTAKLMPHCRAELAASEPGGHSTGHEFLQGVCEGVITTTLYLGSAPPRVDGLICLPSAGMTNTEVLRVLTRYVDAHPHSLNEDIRAVALRAFQEAWPCPKKH